MQRTSPRTESSAIVPYITPADKGAVTPHTSSHGWIEPSCYHKQYLLDDCVWLACAGLHVSIWPRAGERKSEQQSAMSGGNGWLDGARQWAWVNCHAHIIIRPTRLSQLGSAVSSCSCLGIGGCNNASWHLAEGLLACSVHERRFSQQSMAKLRDLQSQSCIGQAVRADRRGQIPRAAEACRYVVRWLLACCHCWSAGLLQTSTDGGGRAQQTWLQRGHVREQC